MIRTITDDLFRPGEPDIDRINRWIRNARDEISQATPDELRWIAALAASADGHPDLYSWMERNLIGMGCRWTLMIVEPNRSAVVRDRLVEVAGQELNVG